MKLVLLLLLATTLEARTRWALPVAIAGCALSAADYAETVAAGPNARELNPLVRNNHGGPSLLKLGLLKGGMCAGTIVVARKRENLGLLMGVPQVGIYSVVVGRNLKELR